MADYQLDDLNEPFLDHENSQDELSEGPDFNYLASLPHDQKYSVQFQGEEIIVDSADWRSSWLLKGQVCVSFLTFILFGLAEQTVGTLIPRLQEDYHIDDLRISLIFLASTTGYFIMAAISEVLHRRVGVRGVGAAGTLSMTAAYLMLSTQPPYFIFVMCYILSGIGFGCLDACLNGWVGGLVDSNQLLGIMHGCYGIGCMISPPLITKLIDRPNNPWHWKLYYIVLSCVGATNLVLYILLYRYETATKYTFEMILKEKKRQLHDKIIADSTEDTFSVDTEEDSESDDNAGLSQALKSKLVWVFSMCLFVYVGGEAAFGSWLVTFMTRIKHQGYRYSSYMATSFWTGLTSGRICLGFVTAHLFKSELMANLVYIVLSTVGYLTFSLFALTSANGILFPIVYLTGLFVGPIFPTTIVAAIEILPVKYHATGVGFICAFGGGGGAAIPFLVGTVAELSTLGLRYYPLIIFALFVILSVAWSGICLRYRGHKRRAS